MRASLLALALGGCATVPPPIPPIVCFSPGGHCADLVVREIQTARRSIHVQAYGFTQPAIAKALADAEGRGIDVEVVLDRSNRSGKSSEAEFVARAGVKTYIDSRHPIAHNKVIVIDDMEVITGSFNFTRAADEKNAENVLVLKFPALARQYLDNWHVHQAHSEIYSPAS